MRYVIILNKPVVWLLWNLAAQLALLTGLEPIKQIYGRLLDISTQESARGISVFPGTVTNHSSFTLKLLSFHIFTYFVSSVCFPSLFSQWQSISPEVVLCYSGMPRSNAGETFGQFWHRYGLCCKEHGTTTFICTYNLTRFVMQYVTL